MDIQPAENSAADERYNLVGEMAILSLLQGLLYQRQALSVQYGAHRESLLTSLLSVRPEGIVFDLGLDAAGNERLLAAKRLYFSCRPDGVQVRFHCDAPQRVAWDNAAACQVPLPQRVTRLQRREYFRVLAPVARPILVGVEVPDLGWTEFMIHNLSVGGVGLAVPDEKQLAIVGQIREGRFQVHRSEPITIGLSCRHVTPISHALAKPTTRVGLSFDPLPRHHEAALQRWIIHLDKERRKFEQNLL